MAPFGWRLCAGCWGFFFFPYTDSKMTEKVKRFKGTTPRGVFVFPKLTEPDFGSKEYPDPDGSFKVQLRLPEAVARSLIDSLQGEMDKAVAQGREAFAKLPVATRKKLGDITVNDFYTPVYDKETEEPTGDVLFRFKAKASGKSKKTGKPWKRVVPLYDARGKIVKGLKEIWSGTEGKISFSAFPYFVAATGACGLSLALEAAQIIRLSAGGERSASDYGFGAEDGDDGFDASDLNDGFSDETGADSGDSQDEGSDTGDF